MKILHIIEDYSIHSGGLRTVVKNLNTRLISLGHQSYILSSREEDGDNIEVIDCFGTPWLYSKKWSKKIKHICRENEIEIVHIHGVWLYPQYIAAKIALKLNIPFLLTPHGMFEPWIWTKGKLKKKVYFNFLSKKLFQKAKKIHVITSDENINIQKLFKNIDTVELPNLIDDETSKLDTLFNNEEKYILFLGRLDQKKGIDILIHAFGKINPKNVILKIAGPINDYKLELDQLIDHYQIKDKVQFLGLVKGDEKINLLRQALIFVAPSHSEVVGMVNLEAAICKTPVITTYQTGLNKGWSLNGGILINPIEAELLKALEDVFKWTKEERNKNGELLYDFVEEHYSWKRRILDWENIYKSLM